MSSISEASVALPFSTFRCEINSFAHQNQTWPSTAILDESGIFNPAWVFPDNLPSRTTDLLSDLAIPDFATSMIPVILRLFPKASSNGHIILLGDNTAVESAIVGMSHPGALPHMRGLSIDHQLVYMIMNHLINHDDVVRTLEKPKTKLDHIFKAGITYCFSLGPEFMSSVIKSTPSPFGLALTQSVFRAALFLGDGPILNAILSMNPGGLVNRSVLLGDHYDFPVQYTSYCGHVEATRVLLDHNADPNNWGKSIHFLNEIGASPWTQDPNTEAQSQIIPLLITHGLEIEPPSLVMRMERCSKDELKVLVEYSLGKSFEVFFNHEGLPIALLREDWDDSLSNTISVIMERASSDHTGNQELWESVLSESLSGAVLRSHVSAVDILLAEGAKPNVNCLISAAQCNNVRILEAFLDRGLNPNARWSKPPYRHGHEYPRKYDFNFERYQDSTALGESIKNHSRGAFQVLQARDFISELSHQPDGFVSAFLAACEVGDVALIDHLLSLQNFPQKLAGMEKALEVSVRDGQSHAVEKLLSVGITPTIRCLELAVENKQLDAVRILTNCMDLSRMLELHAHYSRRFDRFQGRLYENTAIFGAVQWDNITAVSCILSMEYPVDTLLLLGHHKLSDWNMIPLLCPPGYNSCWHLTPLSAAILKGNKTVVDVLIAYGLQAVSFNSQRTCYQTLFLTESWQNMTILTPLAAGVIRNDVRLIQELLTIGANPFDNSAFYICAVLGMTDIATLLLSAFKSRYPESEPSFGCDALYQIIRRKDLRLLRLLAAEINITGPVEKDRGPRPFPDRRAPSNCVFTSPLGEAIRLHAESNGADGGTLDYLLPLVKNHNAVVYRDLKHGDMTGLLYAISFDSLKTVQKLYKACAHESRPTPRSINRTPLQAAAQAGSRDTVEYLLSQGAKANEPPSIRAGATALQLAAITGNIAVAKLLLEAGAEINAPPAFGDGRTAFEGATEHGRIAMMIFLVDEGADLLANSNVQYRRAVVLAEDNRQYAAKDLADKLFARALASQQAGFLGMGEPWAGAEMPDFGTLFP